MELDRERRVGGTLGHALLSKCGAPEVSPIEEKQALKGIVADVADEERAAQEQDATFRHQFSTVIDRARLAFIEQNQRVCLPPPPPATPVPEQWVEGSGCCWATLVGLGEGLTCV